MTKEIRDALIAQLRELDRKLYPSEGRPSLKTRERAQTEELYYKVLGEYYDRLPRMVLSVCPFTGEPLKRAFDPFGPDGPWWHKEHLIDIEEPRAPKTFQVLLGALSLRGRPPLEVQEEVLPGPEVPFVVPRLLSLPGMVAVIGQLALETGDIAYPIAYFSKEAIRPRDLHQPWLREDLWFEEGNETLWTTANDVWDFDIVPYVASGQVKWLRPGLKDLTLLDNNSEEVCPYINLTGERRPQILADGDVEYADLPNGEPLEPFDYD